ncbi:MAG: hypothetical protein HY328_16540 [Chloroflexi bacterium]|nr:hypothetical protein [Chloroflexota bacterium]
MAVQVAGVSDGDGDPLTIRIDSIRQADGNGGVCSGAVTVGVPPSKKGTAVNNGANYDSTRVQGASSGGPVVLDKCCLLFLPVASNK